MTVDSRCEELWEEGLRTETHCQEFGTYLELMLGALKWYPMLTLLPVYPKTPKCVVVVPELTSRKDILSHVGEETETCDRDV